MFLMFVARAHAAIQAETQKNGKKSLQKQCCPPACSRHVHARIMSRRTLVLTQLQVAKEEAASQEANFGVTRRAHCASCYIFWDVLLVLVNFNAGGIASGCCAPRPAKVFPASAAEARVVVCCRTCKKFGA
jgi:hypothetical protein